MVELAEMFIDSRHCPLCGQELIWRQDNAISGAPRAGRDLSAERFE